MSEGEDKNGSSGMKGWLIGGGVITALAVGAGVAYLGVRASDVSKAQKAGQLPKDMPHAKVLGELIKQDFNPNCKDKIKCTREALSKKSPPTAGKKPPATPGKKGNDEGFAYLKNDYTQPADWNAYPEQYPSHGYYTDQKTITGALDCSYQANMRSPVNRGSEDYVRYSRHIAPSKLLPQQATPQTPGGYLTAQDHLEAFVMPDQCDPAMNSQPSLVAGPASYSADGVTYNNTAGLSPLDQQMGMFLDGSKARLTKREQELESRSYQLTPENWRPGFDVDADQARLENPSNLDDLWDKETIQQQDYNDYISTGGFARMAQIDRRPIHPLKGMITNDLRPPPRITLDSCEIPEFNATDQQAMMIAEATGSLPDCN